MKEYKLVVCGCGGVGKSALVIISFVHSVWSTDAVNTFIVHSYKEIFIFVTKQLVSLLLSLNFHYCTVVSSTF